MDRVGALAPTLLAAWTLLGEQGARVGAFEIPELSLSWALIAATFSFFAVPRTESEGLAPRTGLFAIVLLVSYVGLSLWRSDAREPPLGARVLVDGERELVASSLQLEQRRDLRRLTGRRRNVSFETRTTLEVPRSGEYTFEIECDDSCELAIGDEHLRESRTLTLQRGELPFALRYRQDGGPAALLFDWNTPSVIELLPMEYYLGDGEPRSSQRLAAHVSLLFSIGWWLAFSVFVIRLAPHRARILESRWAPATAATLIILYGSLLRYDALLVHAGLPGHERLRGFVPGYALFNPATAPEDPYRADVRSYLDRAETFSWKSFYAPSFREPFYIALTMPFLAMAGGEIGILVQSFFFSCATLVLFFLVARKLHGSSWWAVMLLVPVALHEWLLREAPSGYRMSAYSFFLLASVAWMFLSSSRRTAAALAGALAGLLCLVRLSALSVVVPLLVLKLWQTERKERLAYATVFAIVLVALVAPFLVSNAATHGDPFYSISFHTEFWLRAEGLHTEEGPVAWTRYLTDFGRLGALTKGTLAGMTVLPVRTFWTGLRHFPVLNFVTLGLGLLGLLLSVRSTRIFLAGAYFGHLIPFAYIQNFPSGEMPRFVMPAYFFVVLAVPLMARRSRSPD